MALSILYTVLASISLVASIFMIFLHIKLPQLIKHPGSLVFAQCIAQAFFDLHWYTSLISVEEFFGEIYCEVLGGFNVFVYFLFWNYSACLGLEILHKLRSRIITAYRRRLLLYHVFSLLISVLVVLIIVPLYGFGESTLGTCFIKSHSDAQLSEFVPLVIHTPIMWVALITTLRKLKTNYTKIQKNYFLVVCSLTLTLSGCTLFALFAFILHVKALAVVAWILGTSSGFTIAVARLWNKKLLQEVKAIIKFRRSGRQESTLLIDMDDEEGNFLGDLFIETPQKVKNRQNIFEILSLLVLRFKSRTEFDLQAGSFNWERTSSEDTSAKFKFTFTQFREAAQVYDISIIETVHSKTLTLEEYAPRIFACIRDELTYYPEVLLQSLSLKENFQSQITSTFDDTLVLKTVSKTDAKFFLKHVLEAYMNRILLNPQSRLARILGLFRVLPSKEYFLLMENISPLSIDRKTIRSKNLLGEDSESNDSYVLDLDYHLKQIVFNSFKRDMEFLREFGIVNYKIALGVHSATSIDSRYVFRDENGQVFTLAILDFFQSYNGRRSYRDSPESYYMKQLEFLRKLLNM